MRGDYTQSYVGTLRAVLEFCPDPGVKANSASCSHLQAPTLEDTWIHVAVSSLPNDPFSAASSRSELDNLVVCRPPCQPELGPACTFLTLIASIHNHCSRRGKARRALEEQAGASRGVDLQSLLLAALETDANDFIRSVEPAITVGTGDP